ncbi:DNA polymerase III subunit gamma/tau [Aureispira anguillae]|uniref:DNA polymerase III subunit gamma/tau n=1 Tax=Aureispira anguillae TaxID=2864201 RepID=A0A915YIQ6_9BACT|nr:DNA polymerase III subunit gamma/tau [Aureispira anguillae]BDS13744.1 DNA polymerase III subunit gamma/tau [Aureispira anguillae]
MSNFVVSARKYRPIRFDDVVGQQHVSQTLKNAIQSNHLAQAFLFCGPRGVGKTTCARILAKVLNCQAPTEAMEPCDTCESCQSFNNNASLNISELDAASNNSVEHIRALIEQVRFAPQSGQYKIYIIDEVHMLSQQAFNAFLKTLEEPPAYAIFILATTEKHKIIPTILSRCQIFDFNRIQVADMAAHLQRICQEEAIEAEEEALNVIAQKADGALRDALSIFDRIVSFSGNSIAYKDVIENLNILDYDYYFKVVEAILTENASQLLLLFDQISRKGFDGDIFVNGLAEHLRNLLVCKDAKTLELLEVSGNIKDRYQQQAALVPMALVLSALSIANDCDVNYKMARNSRLHVEMALIKMAYIQRAMRPQVTVAAPLEKKTVDDNIPNTLQDTAPNYSPPPVEKNVIEPQKETTKTTTTSSIDSAPKAELKSDNKPVSMPETVKVSSNFAEKLAKKAGNGFLSKITDQVKEEQEQPAEEAMPFTLDNLEIIWKQYWSAIESQSTQILFKTAQLSILDEEKGTLKIVTAGNRAKDAIFRDRAVRQLLINTFQKKELSFEVEIDQTKIETPKPQKMIPQTDREKYVHFLKLNPVLKEFQKRFQLLPPKNN